MTDIIEAVAHAMFAPFSGGDCTCEDCEGYRAQVKRGLRVATPIITEKVLRDMLWEASNNGEWYSMQLFIKHLARTRYGIDLTKDTDNG